MRIVMLVPASVSAGINIVAQGLLDTLNNKKVHAAVLPEIESDYIESRLLAKQQDDLLLEIFEQTQTASLDKDMVIVQGISLAKSYAAELNRAIAQALDASIIFVVAIRESLDQIARQLRVVASSYNSERVIGAIVNKASLAEAQIVVQDKIKLLGAGPYKNDLVGRGSAAYIGSIVGGMLDFGWLWPFLNNVAKGNFTPAMFRSNLFSRAKAARKRIVLPEGSEERTLKAANICASLGVAQCVLLSSREAVQTSCDKYGIKLSAQIEVIDPKSVAARYVDPLCEARRSKGLTRDEAIKQLESNTVLGTVMLYLGEVDGLVSGAIHTTADTIRPALQIIKTTPSTKLVSSIFFMCLPDQMLVYGDCAINPNPTSEELADIAIQSAASAEAFGIIPRVAMLSYSTGGSGFGPDVDKVKAAVEIAKKLQPHLLVDGPLQYDAAIDPEVAKLKAPNSMVAGRATVFVVPDLDVGNIAYKAVQRSTGVVCVGPMLQGLRKPVNDLSRGCTVEDIVSTIAITAVQAI